MSRVRRVSAALAATALLAGCTAGDGGASGAPTPPPSAGQSEPPELGPSLPPIDPCILDAAAVSAAVGVDVPEGAPSGGELFALCTYGDPEIALGTADIALVDLARVSEESEDDVDGETYIDELASGVGAGDATDLDDLGDGSAVLLTYPFGSQAWAYVDGFVYGAYASDLGDDDALAVDLLEAVLDEVAR
jgi:hypothetical protein